MNLWVVLFGLAMACKTVGQPESDTQRFRVDVPKYADSKQTHLLLRDVVTPRNRPVVLRAYALAADNSKVYLGSTAVPGVSPDATGVTSLSVLRINVTTGFRRWLTVARSARKVDIEISSSSGGDTAAKHESWSIRAAELVNPK